MILIKEYDSDLNKLNEISKLNCFTSARSSENINIHWTKLEFLNCYLVNIFSPMNSIFWSFDYDISLRLQSFHHYEFETVHGKGDNDFKNTEKNIVKCLKEVGSKKKSILSNTLMYGITKYYGDFFLLSSSSPDNELAVLNSGRHFSFIAPLNMRENLMEYYRKQAIEFGDNSIISLNEDVFMLSSPSLVNFKHELLLEKMIMYLSTEEIYTVLKTIDDISINGSDWAIIENISHHYSISNFLGISPVKKNSSEHIKIYKKIVEFRIKFALDTVSIKQLESIRNTLSHNIGLWNDEYKKINLNFLGMIDEKLSKYSLIKKCHQQLMNQWENIQKNR